jgi:hypothetical protein
MDEEVIRLEGHYNDLTETLGELASELNPKKIGYGLAVIYL